MQMPIKEFFGTDTQEDTPQNANINIALNTNDNVLWNGLYKDIPENIINSDVVVTSYDITEMSDNTLDIAIIIE